MTALELYTKWRFICTLIVIASLNYRWVDAYVVRHGVYGVKGSRMHQQGPIGWTGGLL